MNKTRKELPRTALPRVYFIDRQIASGCYPNTRSLAEGYEASEATINRDIEFMRNSLNAPIIYDHDHNGYYYGEKTYRLSAGYATVGEMLALGIAKNLLAMYRDTPLYPTLRQMLDVVSLPLVSTKPETELLDWYENRIIVPDIAAAPMPDTATWQTIVQGLQCNRVITFEYLGAWDEAPRPRRVRPWQLLFDVGLWFLYAYDEEQSAPRMFSLPRIEKAACTQTEFALPDNFDYRALSGGSYFGVFAGFEKRHFRVAFYDEAIVWARDRTWAADQTICDVDTHIEMDFTSSQYDKVLDWVLSRGGNAVPLEPPQLVSDWQEQIKRMQERSQPRK